MTSVLCASATTSVFMITRLSSSLRTFTSTRTRLTPTLAIRPQTTSRLITSVAAPSKTLQSKRRPTADRIVLTAYTNQALNKRATSTMTGDQSQTNGAPASKPVLFFDIDNCLYPRILLKPPLLSWDDAVKLHKEYYTNYGLAIEGLVRHHEIDPLEYNSKVDDALPLEDILTPDPELRQLLQDIDRSKVSVRLFTNAYKTHGQRVVKLLGIEDQFEGLTFCDYAEQPLTCKPAKAMYLKAMQHAGVERPEDCYFVDDSYQNCKAAQEYGWTAAHLVEEGLPVPRTPASQYQIRHLQELRNVYPQFFKSASS
ncbi:hypothetical protein BN1708_009418 [Verticillium longisporum]|uniref:Pyrimidine 5'-nucleotidase n=1 Tax=Verticillium longisporum TaxID=100787 RepID=A0A0G4KGM5_VERLO|nr:hypothetical protein BN1708_009418 [Verticillium longisporum]